MGLVNLEERELDEPLYAYRCDTCGTHSERDGSSFRIARKRAILANWYIEKLADDHSFDEATRCRSYCHQCGKPALSELKMEAK